MSHSKFHREGRMPLYTLQADIDYGSLEARTTFGRIDVKVWTYRGGTIEWEFTRMQAEQVGC